MNFVGFYDINTIKCDKNLHINENKGQYDMITLSEEGKNHFDLYKYLCFPWGAFVLTPIWLGITTAIGKFFSNITFTTNANTTASIPWWCSWALFVVGEIVLIAFLAIYSYALPKGKKNCHNVFILITPELFKDDKYITRDFVECFERHAKNSIENLNVVVPAVLKRESFNRTIQRYQRKRIDYWTSKRWKKRHKKLQGVLYISGTLMRRSSHGKEQYVFTLSATIGFSNVNKNIVPMMMDELKENFPQRILINREFELEEFEGMSERFATFAEYLIGWAHLVSGHLKPAFEMHFDIYSNNKQSFFKRGALHDLTKLLQFEIDSVLKYCKMLPLEFVSTCINATKQICPNTDTATLLVARSLMMTSTDNTFDSNLAQAQSLVSQARVNSQNRDIVHADRAYILLLKGDYLKAESEYRALFKKPNVKLFEDIIDYCNGQILAGCTKERPTAIYVKAVMLHHLEGKEKDLMKTIKQGEKLIPQDHEYYHKKLHEIVEERQKPKRKSGR